jgi:hypothetical protein
MKRTKIIIYPSPPWTEGTVARERMLQARRAVSCVVEASTTPKGWKMTVVREYPDG